MKTGLSLRDCPVFFFQSEGTLEGRGPPRHKPPAGRAARSRLLKFADLVLVMPGRPHRSRGVRSSATCPPPGFPPSLASPGKRSRSVSRCGVFIATSSDSPGPVLSAGRVARSRNLNSAVLEQMMPERPPSALTDEIFSHCQESVSVGA